MLFLALLIIAIWVNRASRGGLFLSLVIGASAYAFIPLGQLTDRHLWFMIVLFSDAFIIMMAVLASCRASLPIIGLSFMLCVGHLIDWKYGTDPIYYQIANWLEYLEIVSCIIFSPVVLNLIKERIRHAYRSS